MRFRVTLLTLALLAVPFAAHDDDGGVGGADIVAGTDGTTLTITGSRDLPGTGTEDSTSDRDDASAPSDPSARPRTLPDECSPLGSRVGSCAGAPVVPPVEAIPAITMSDLAQFAPQPITTTAEPGNIGIAGMPTNFLAAAEVQTRSGTIVGYPITVRFTPAAYDHHYGDGTTATLTTPGLTWAALGQLQFTPTATSHTYQERGTYLADVDVRYTAEVDLGTGWFPVDGQLTTDGPAQEIRILEAHTALVAHTCLENPAAAGC